jgi:dTDP-4-dehydrorhamnose reductase
VKALVLGAGGMLGRAVVGEGRRAGHEIAGLARAELDVTDTHSVARAVAAAEPDLVVNCAAFTDVDGAEAEVEAALRVNRDGAAAVAAAAERVGAAIVYPSTDYVFDGRKREPYVESDDPAPLSSYGRSKLAGERATAEANPRHFVVRTSWLFGVGGRNFVETMLGLAAQGRSVRVIDDQVGSPTFCGHLAAGLLRLAGEGGYGVHHATADGACSWFELAGHVFAAAGLECDLSPCSTAEMPRPATRPAYSVLRSERADGIRLPHWRDGVAAYLAEREPAVGGTRR